MPLSLQHLAGLPARPLLARPLATLGVAALLAAALLALPGRTTSRAADATSAQPGAAAQGSEAADRDAASPLAAARPDRSLDDIARAARGLGSSEPPIDEPAAPRSGSGTGPQQDASRVARATQGASTRPGDPAQAAAHAARTVPAPADAAPTPVPATSGLPGTAGTDAGRSADERAVVGASRALPGPLVVQRSPLGPRTADAGALQASDETGEHLDVPPASRSTQAAAPHAPPAAAPPATVESRMTPAETHYVRAWARALGPAR